MNRLSKTDNRLMKQTNDLSLEVQDKKAAH